MRALLACLVVLLLGAAPASAAWSTTGTGTGSATTATVPTGATPTVTVTGRSVKVTWAQNAFDGSTLGARGGSYTLTRYAEGSTTAITPGGTCAGAQTGTADPLTCTETNVPFGRWVYRVTPNLDSFTGTQGPPSAVAPVTLAAPVLNTATPRNPATGATDGPIALGWSAVADATGYYVFRRVAGGSYDFTAPLNGSTALTGTTYSDTTATSSTTYDYVVVAVNTPPLTTSVASNQLTAKVITRPPAPAGAVTAVRGSGGALDVSWSAVGVAAGYNVYRRTSTATTFDFTAPLNGATPVTATTFHDTTAVAGTSYVYVIRSEIVGADAVQVESVNSALSTAQSCASTYNATITAAAPTSYFRLADMTALVATNASSALRNGTYGGGVTFGQAGAIGCDANTAVLFDGSSGSLGAALTTAAVTGPNVFSAEVWFKTTSATGGKLVGFGNARTGASSQYDRHLYLTDGGRVSFGVYPGAVKTVTSPASYGDGQWHLAVATLGAAGQRLYVDGAEVGSDPAVTTGEAYSGYWRAGYDNLNSWTNQPTSPFFAGTLDEFAVYGTQLSAAAVLAHYTAGRG